MSQAPTPTAEERARDVRRHLTASTSAIGSELAILEAEVRKLQNGRDALQRMHSASMARETACRAALGQLLDQVEQMKGLFPDEDGAIARAMADAEAALNSTGVEVSNPIDVRASAFGQAKAKIVELIIARQSDTKRKNADFNRGAVDALHDAKAAIIALIDEGKSGGAA